MQIILQNLRFQARHGVMPQERQVGQNYELTLRLDLPDADSCDALLDDRLEGTVNYAEVYELVRSEMQQPSALLERVGERIVEALLQRFPKVMGVEISLTKLAPPIPGWDGVGATVKIRRSRTLLVLDFDGTLADTSRGIIATMCATFDACGYAHPTDEAICRTIGLPLVDSIAQLAGGISGAPLQRAVDTYHRLFEEIGTKNVLLFPHVGEVLHRLHRMGATLAIATSRGHESVTQLCRNLGILDCMAHVVACEDVAQAKPHPDMVLQTMEHLNIAPADTLMVGDAVYDIQMGHNAGVHTCGVTYGNGTRADMVACQADYIIDDFGQLGSLLL